MNNEQNRYTSKLYEPATSLTASMIADKKNKVKQDQLYYPRLHLAPPFGLLNDPNGLAYFNGYYYIFYQYHPNQVDHGLKHWRMFKTKNFTTYDDFGITLAPHNEDDNFGVYSGGAIPFNDELLLFYTANHRDLQDTKVRKQTQYLVSLNKEDTIKERIQIIPYNDNYTDHFRDPYPIILNGIEYILIGGQRHDKSGCIVAYECSHRFRTIVKVKELKLPQQLNSSYMIECPCLFQQDEQFALIFSPQGLTTEVVTQKNIFDVMYVMGTSLDELANKPLQQLDYGFDFYAPQVFNDGQRSILIGWLGQAMTIYPYDEIYEWSQMLTLPREIKIQDNQIYQLPLPEVLVCRKAQRDITTFQEITSRVMDFEFHATHFEMKIGNDLNYIQIALHDDTFTFDRSHMDKQVNIEYGCERVVQLKPCNHEFRIIVDASAIEIFIDAGRYVLTSRFFIENMQYIKVSGDLVGNMYDMNEITVKECF